MVKQIHETIKPQGKSTILEAIVVEPAKIDNAVLRRLIEEIDLERENHINAYNRTHNRHNRGR